MKFLISILLLGFCRISVAQVTLSGRVTDPRNRPLPGASVLLRNSYDGATTDSAGRFSFQTDEKGNWVLEITASGYQPFTLNLDLSGPVAPLQVALKEQITELKAVVITAGSFEASDKTKGAVLSSIDVVTTPSANGDLTSAFKSLPGTQQVGESEGLFVRGGAATESKIYMDGTLVNNFFYSSTPGIASRGRFNPFLFKGTVFSTGGYSALYGQALSAALILESIDLPERSEADLGITVVGIGGGLQQLAKNKKSSWGLSFNYTHLGLAFAVIQQRQDYFRVPVAFQGDANFRIRTRNGMLKYYGYYSSNTVGFRTADLDSLTLKQAFRLTNQNMYHNLSWRERFGRGWRLQAAASYSTNRDDIRNEMQDADNRRLAFTGFSTLALKQFNLLSRSRYAQGRFVLEKKFAGLSALRFGADHFYSDERATYTLFNAQRFDERLTDHLTAAFAETDLYLTNALAAKLGSRLEYSSLMKGWNLAPRVSLAYKTGANSQASLAYGIFYQSPERRIQPALPGLGFAKSVHYIGQYLRQTRDYTFRAEVFYKHYADLYKTALSSTGREVAVNNNGKGYAKGIEFFWRDKKSIRNVDYWISYSWLDTERDYLNFPSPVQPSFATAHTAAFVFKRFVLPWKTGFNFSYNFATGRPYYHILYNSASGKHEFTDRGTTIAYHNVSFSVNYLPNLGRKDARSFAVFVLGVNNVLGQRQVFTYQYSSDGSRKEPVGPPSLRFVFIGCFLSFGTDRTQQAINNNL